ncbi:uncharacterized protein LOC123229909 [Mangifera indica]|uniref:uncharacterized protein LOC123229909 n=1 Tax=Mangifera indica TaxID=29780 RepID=UPI001CFBBA27|nr:uncharacterized protein LOC123229909 [Mangifera indica]
MGFGTIEGVGLKAMEHSYILMPVLLAFFSDGDSIVAKQSIVTGTNFFCRFLEDTALQFHWHRKVERWLEELWTWTVSFKDAAFSIALEMKDPENETAFGTQASSARC